MIKNPIDKIGFFFTKIKNVFLLTLINSNQNLLLFLKLSKNV